MLDTGLVHDGYFCDFDRNFAVGDVSAEVDAAHGALIEATHAAFLPHDRVLVQQICFT